MYVHDLSNNMLMYVLLSLFSVAEYETFNKMGTYNLAVVFGPSLVRPRPEDVV